MNNQERIAQLVDELRDQWNSPYASNDEIFNNPTVDKVVKKINNAYFDSRFKVFDKLVDMMLYMMGMKDILELDIPSEKNMPFYLELVQILQEGFNKSVKELTFHDYLGAVLETLGLANTHNGQFFTPSTIADFMARLVAPLNKYQDNILSSLKNDEHGNIISVMPKLISVADISGCGSGRMLMGAHKEIVNSLDVLRKAGEDIQQAIPNVSPYLYARYYGVDIDYRSVKILIFNSLIYGMSGEYICGNSLFLDNNYRFGVRVESVNFTDYYRPNAAELFNMPQERVDYIRNMIPYYHEQTVFHNIKEENRVVFSAPNSSIFNYIYKVEKDDCALVLQERAQIKANTEKKAREARKGTIFEGTDVKLAAAPIQKQKPKRKAKPKPKKKDVPPTDDLFGQGSLF